MFRRNLFRLVIFATLTVSSQALPANSIPSDIELKYAKLKAENPFPAKEPYIHIENANDKPLATRRFLDTLKSSSDLIGAGNDKDNKPRDVKDPSCSSDAECWTNTAIFNTDLNDFIENHRNKGLNSPPLIYESDGCSVPPEVAKLFKIDKDFPYGYEFLNSCYRHDFGYRNYKAQDRFTPGNRERIDKQFEEDLLAQCKSQFPKANILHPDQFFKKKWCDTVAKVYYKFVRLCGGGECKVDEVVNLFKQIVH
ncbi:hypothetical protein TWF730_003937 [Orbilia blumenaviensis]|uniref:Uncharacterized protein n=1 Tax=Orbilia blumenaviensis TaxID=1796055 RepID=A0AAV9U0S9_9PEZI